MKKLLLFVVLIITIITLINISKNSLPEAITNGNASAPNILLVNQANSLPFDYNATGLINLYEQKNRSFELDDTDIKMCEVAYKAMQKMFYEASKENVTDFVITSGYRTKEKQQEIYKNAKKGQAAKPGESEHQTGLAFDVMTNNSGVKFENTFHCKWLIQNCAKYGFILRYPKGKERITGFPYEPWHFRYVGTPHSETIMREGITLEEYLGAI